MTAYCPPGSRRLEVLPRVAPAPARDPALLRGRRPTPGLRPRRRGARRHPGRRRPPRPHAGRASRRAAVRPPPSRRAPEPPRTGLSEGGAAHPRRGPRRLRAPAPLAPARPDRLGRGGRREVARAPAGHLRGGAPRRGPRAPNHRASTPRRDFDAWRLHRATTRREDPVLEETSYEEDVGFQPGPARRKVCSSSVARSERIWRGSAAGASRSGLCPGLAATSSVRASHASTSSRSPRQQVALAQKHQAGGERHTPVDEGMIPIEQVRRRNLRGVRRAAHPSWPAAQLPRTSPRSAAAAPPWARTSAWITAVTIGWSQCAETAFFSIRCGRQQSRLRDRGWLGRHGHCSGRIGGAFVGTAHQYWPRSQVPSLCGTLARPRGSAVHTRGSVLPEFANQLRQCFIRESWNEVR